MKTTKEQNIKIPNTNKGITLIALVITIIVMLILVAVTISMAVNGGLFDYAGKATGDTQNAINAEQKLSKGEINVGGVWYNSIKDYINNTPAEDQTGGVEGVVARISTTYYKTLQDAIDAVADNKTQTTINLLKDISENVTISENKNIILNLDGKTITNKENTAIINLSGKLTVNNGTIMGTYNEKVPTIYVGVNSELNLSNTIIDRYSTDEYLWESIELYGNLNIASGKINSPNANAICTYKGYVSQINISGTAQITSNGYPALVNQSGAKAIIRGGAITSTNGSAIKNYGEVEISENAQITCDGKSGIHNLSGAKAIIRGRATISTNNGSGVNNYGEIEISENAQITSDGIPGIYNQSGAKAIIRGRATISTNNNAIVNYGEVEISENAQINGNGYNTPTLYNQSGAKAIIRGGTITAIKSYSIYNIGTATVTGAILNGITYGISNT